MEFFIHSGSTANLGGALRDRWVAGTMRMAPFSFVNSTMRKLITTSGAGTS